MKVILQVFALLSSCCLIVESFDRLLCFSKYFLEDTHGWKKSCKVGVCDLVSDSHNCNFKKRIDQNGCNFFRPFVYGSNIKPMEYSTFLENNPNDFSKSDHHKVCVEFHCQYHLPETLPPFCEISSTGTDNGTTDNNQSSNTLLNRTEPIQNQTEALDSLGIVSSVKSIEDTLRAIALNISTENVTKTDGAGFHMVSTAVRGRLHRKVRLDMEDVSVRIDVNNTGQQRIVVQATKLEISRLDLASLIPTKRNGTAADASLKHVTTTVFPGSPYISIASYAVNGNQSVFLAPSFTLPIKSSELDEFVTRITPRHRGRSLLTELVPRCSFVNTSTGQLSQRGCRNVQTERRETTTCSCNHTTMFAVLLTATVITVPRGVQIVSYVGETASVICLVVTLIVLIKLRKAIRSDRTVAQINLVLALLLLHVCCLFQDVAVANSRSCEMITVLIHLFLLASGCWMSVDGLVLLVKLSSKTLEYKDKNPKVVCRLKHCLGWGTPGVIVILSASAGFITNTYMDKTDAYTSMAIYKNTTIPMYSYCWISAKSSMRFPTVVLPLMCLWFFNVFVVAKVTYFVAKMRRQEARYAPQESSTGDRKTDLNQIVAALRALCILLPVLGVPWIFAFLAGVPDLLASKVFMYLNAIVNGLQGVLLMLIYCVMGDEVRQAVRRAVKNYSASRSTS